MRGLILSAGLSLAGMAVAQASSSCTLTPGDLSLGSYTWLHPTSTSGVAARIACTLTPQSSVQVRLSVDMQDRTPQGLRILNVLSGTQGPLLYQLSLLDRGVTLPWGDGTGQTATFLQAWTNTAGVDMPFTAEAAFMMDVPAGQMVPSGTYTDTLTLTLDVLAP